MTVAAIKGLALGLLALGIGYIVCVIASKETGLSRILGYVIGTTIILSSILVVALRLHAMIPSEETRRKVISNELGPKRMVDMQGPMSPPKK